MLNKQDLLKLCDGNGFLRQDTFWTDDIAVAIAALESINLSTAHWEIIYLLREFYSRYGDSPANRALVNYVRNKVGPTKGSSHYLLGLFPGSPARVGSRIAGLPKPKNCL